MTKQEATELISAKIKAAKTLVEEISVLASEHDITMMITLNAEGETGTENVTAGWYSSSWNC